MDTLEPAANSMREQCLGMGGLEPIPSAESLASADAVVVVGQGARGLRRQEGEPAAAVGVGAAQPGNERAPASFKGVVATQPAHMGRC